MGIAACFVTKMTSGMGFVGCFVFGEARITINPEHGTAMCPWVCFVEGRDGFQVRRYADNVFAHRVNNRLVVTGLVGGKPIPVVVLFEFIEEPEEIFWETVEFRHFSNKVRNTGNANSKADTYRNSRNRPDPGVQATGS